MLAPTLTTKAHPSHEFCDAQTEPQSRTLYATGYFYNAHQDIPVNEYRLRVHDTLSVNEEPCDSRHAFRWNYSETGAPTSEQSEDIPRVTQPLSTSDKRLHDDASTSLAKHDNLVLNSDWQSLPARHIHEKMLCYHLDAEQDVDIDRPYDDGLYYIRLQSGQAIPETLVTISYLLQKLPGNVNYDGVAFKLPVDIQYTVSRCREFGSDGFSLDTEQPTGHDYLNVIANSNVGACRHRCVIFKNWMAKNHPDIRVCRVTNDVHDYIEMHYEDRSITIDLWGYEQTLNIRPLHTPPLRCGFMVERSAVGPAMFFQMDPDLFKQAHLLPQDVQLAASSLSAPGMLKQLR